MQTSCKFTIRENPSSKEKKLRRSCQRRAFLRLANRFILVERFVIGHGSTPLVHIPTYVCTFPSTPLHRVEWNEYREAHQKWVHSTRVRTYRRTYLTLHLRTYLRTNVRSTPLHITEWSGMIKEYEIIHKTRC
jgi:hypothetical protein